MNYIERTRLPWQWISHDIELLELKVGRDRATVDVKTSRGEQKLVRRVLRETIGDEPRHHRTDVYCGHLSIWELFCHIDRPVVSKHQVAANESIASERESLPYS